MVCKFQSFGRDVVIGNPGLGSRPLLDVAVQNVAETVTHPVLSSPGPNSTVLSMISSKDIYCEPNNTILLYLNSNMYQRQPHNGVISTHLISYPLLNSLA